MYALLYSPLDVVRSALCLRLCALRSTTLRSALYSLLYALRLQALRSTLIDSTTLRLCDPTRDVQRPMFNALRGLTT
jgi:hypothetical protein